ncbi:MAG: ribosome-associated translation inhibitor RaiA [Candidatus Paceibacterota bacterium]|jgi:putative sigma-54 modulation protein
MKYNVNTTDFSLTPAISDYLDKRIAHLDKFINPNLEESIMCYVEVGKTTNHHKTGDLFRTEFTIHIGGKTFRATSEKEDLYASIDTVSDEVTQELKAFKGKRNSLFKRGASKVKSIIKGLYGSNN